MQVFLNIFNSKLGSKMHQVLRRRLHRLGNSRTSVEGRSRDLLVEQLPPVSVWGKKFAVPPTPHRPDRPDVLKIVCQQDGTSVMVSRLPFLLHHDVNL